MVTSVNVGTLSESWRAVVKLWAESSSLLHRAGLLLAQKGHMRPRIIIAVAAAAVVAAQAGPSAQVRLACMQFIDLAQAMHQTCDNLDACRSCRPTQ